MSGFALSVGRGQGKDEIREISEVSGKAATGVKLCKPAVKACRLNQRSALVARECRKNLMHEMDGMLEAWLGARGTYSLTHGGAGWWVANAAAVPNDNLFHVQTTL